MKKAKRHKCSNCSKVRYERFMLMTNEVHANRRDPKWICRDCKDKHMGYGYFESATGYGYRKKW